MVDIAVDTMTRSNSQRSNRQHRSIGRGQRTMLARQPLAENNSRLMESIPTSERLIVALDLPNSEKAEALVEELGETVQFYKIGMQLQFAGGLQLAERLISEYKKKVFLDSKLLDISQTIKGAVENIAKMGVSFLTIHGGGKNIRSAVAASRGTNLKIFTITVLTHLDAHDLMDLYGMDLNGGFQINVEDLVRRRAIQAIHAGADGVIASGLEAAMIREISGAISIITPGIRPDGSEIDEQVRITTPRQAILAGADYLVVGRPILHSENRKAEAKRILDEIRDALAERKRLSAA
jgi:orotidine-5'-phosphate decarboxylase